MNQDWSCGLRALLEACHLPWSSPTEAGVGKCPFLGIYWTSPKQISVGIQILPAGVMLNFGAFTNPCKTESFMELSQNLRSYIRGLRLRAEKKITWKLFKKRCHSMDWFKETSTWKQGFSCLALGFPAFLLAINSTNNLEQGYSNFMQFPSRHLTISSHILPNKSITNSCHTKNQGIVSPHTPPKKSMVWVNIGQRWGHGNSVPTVDTPTRPYRPTVLPLISTSAVPFLITVSGHGKSPTHDGSNRMYGRFDANKTGV